MAHRPGPPLVPDDWEKSELVVGIQRLTLWHPLTWIQDQELDTAIGFQVFTDDWNATAQIALSNAPGILTQLTTRLRLGFFVTGLLNQYKKVPGCAVDTSRVGAKTYMGPYGQIYETTIPFCFPDADPPIALEAIHLGTRIGNEAKILLGYNHAGVVHLTNTDVFQARQVFGSIRVEE